jgi:hypothetical protein
LKFIENEELASFSKTSEVKELAETLLENEERNMMF